MTGKEIGLLLAVTPIIALVGNPVATAISDYVAAHKTYLLTTVGAAMGLTLLILFQPSFPILLAGVILVSFLRNPSFPILDALVLALLGEDRKDEYGRQRLWGSAACGVSTAIVGWMVDVTGKLEVIIWSHVAFLGAFWIALLWFPIKGVPQIREVTDDVEFSPVSTLVSADEEDQLSQPDHVKEEGEGFVCHDALGSADDQLEEEEDIFEGWQPLSGAPPSTRPDFPQVHPLSAEASPGSPDADANALSRANSFTSSRPSYDPIQGQPSYEHVVCDPTLFVFVIAVFVMSISVAVVDNFLYLFLADEMGGSTTFAGISKIFQVGLEVPTFYFSKQIMQRMSFGSMLLLAQFILVVRLCGYGLIPLGRSVWYALPSESLHGVYFGIMWTAAVRFADDRAPDAYKATAQGLLTSIYGGLGPAAGAYLGGWWWENTHGKMVKMEYAA
ncbi:hypothetical protein PhCBS80983_g05367 [Powellomyces hirtus]|uniref:Major facilitator superfamily associated domain-containing protein n=1 Tax=Powellomyces hirtus TaxID=109895 RepID=A0A507DV80_9FUNG|nr:hypothetical protein PhCBS80983_g05367 [Powellomyces hirtus]